MGIWTRAFLCALCRLTWLPLACTAGVIWIRTHHVSCTHSSESLTSLSLPLSLYYGGGGVYMEGGFWVAAGCFVCSWVSGYPACPALVLPGHVSHRLSLLFTFLMRGAGLCDMWLTAMCFPLHNPPSATTTVPSKHRSPTPPSSGQPGLWLFGWFVLWRRRRNFFFLTHLFVFLWEVFFSPSSWTLLLWAGLVERGLWESGGVMVDMDTHTFLSHNYPKMMTHLMTHSLFSLRLDFSVS